MQGPPRRRIAAAVLLFAVTSAFYAATFSFRNISDTDLNSLQTRALALHGDVDVSRYRLHPLSLWTNWHGGRYAIYGVGVSLPAVPIYAVAARAGASDRFLQAAAAIPFVAAAVVVMYAVLLRLFPAGLAAASALVFGFGTTMWPVAAMAFYQNGATQLFQAIGIAGFLSRSRRAPVLAGFGFASATLVRPLAAFVLLGAGLYYLVRERRSVVPYALGALVPIAGIVIQNRWIWGGWLTGGYSHNIAGYRGDVPEALWGLVFGWWRGLLAYSPVLILGFAGWVMAIRRRRGFLEERLVVLGAVSVATILLYSKFTTWHGGLNQFGYRYLLDIVPFLVVLGAFAVHRWERVRPWATLFGALSILTMTFGAGPNDFGYDSRFFATDLAETSLGQAWIAALDDPVGSMIRLAGVAAIGWLIYRSASDLRPAVADQ
jgi:hypothetical protein